MKYYIEVDEKTDYATGMLIRSNDNMSVGNYISIDEQTYMSLVDNPEIKAFRISDAGKLELDTAKKQEYEAKNDKIMMMNTYLHRISDLKQSLSDLDYIDIKYLEGCLDEEEFRKKVAVKQSYRDEINDLERKIAELENG